MREPVASPSTHGETGFYNRFGGFHRNTDAQAYRSLLWIIITSRRHAVRAFALRMVRDRWAHRRCDTTDFHHFDCPLGVFARRVERDEAWIRTLSPW